jgi:hypothetical protein
MRIKFRAIDTHANHKDHVATCVNNSSKNYGDKLERKEVRIRTPCGSSPWDFVALRQLHDWHQRLQLENVSSDISTLGLKTACRVIDSLRSRTCEILQLVITR